MMYAIIVFMLFYVQLKPAPCDDTRLNILHTASFLSAFEEKEMQGKLFYGIARLVAFVNKEKKSSTPTVYFDNMNWWTGSIWYSVHRWKICAAFVKRLPVDAMVLGNNEMTDGPKGVREQTLRRYLLAVNKTVVCGNCDLLPKSIFRGLLQTSKIIEVSGIKIGVTGYIAKYIGIMVEFTNMAITNEVSAVQAEIDKMTREGVKIIIVLAHAGYKMDQEFAKNLRDVDVIVGGHSHTFLYNGTPPMQYVAHGPYPTIVTNEKAQKVLLVYAGHRGRFVGKLQLTFNENGEITHYEGNPVHMDDSIEKDKETENILQTFKKEVDNMKNVNIGKTMVYLNGSCRYSECNFGNVLVDSFVDYRAANHKGHYWTDVSIAILNAGAIAGSIQATGKDNTFTLAAVYSALPYLNMLMKIKLRGDILRNVIEHAVHKTDIMHGKFLQVSGIRVAFDLALQPYHKIISVQVRCATCEIPAYSDLDDDTIYTIIAPQFLADGGDGYKMLADNVLEKNSEGVTELDVLKRYLEYYQTPLQVGTEERIIIYDIENPQMRTRKSAQYVNRDHWILLYSFLLLTSTDSFLIVQIACFTKLTDKCHETTQLLCDQIELEPRDNMWRTIQHLLKLRVVRLYQPKYHFIAVSLIER